jgi:hypothetical protein
MSNDSINNNKITEDLQTEIKIQESVQNRFQEDLNKGLVSFFEIKYNDNTNVYEYRYKNTETKENTELLSFSSSEWCVPFIKSISKVEDDCDYNYNGLRYYCVTLPNYIYQFELLETLKPAPVISNSTKQPYTFTLTKDVEDEFITKMSLDIAKINNNEKDQNKRD